MKANRSHIARLVFLAAATPGVVACASLLDTDPEVRVRPLTNMSSATNSGFDGNYESAVAAISSRDYARALDYLQVARANDPRNVRVLNAFGVVYDKLGRFDLSARYYAEASAVDPASKIVAQNVAYSKLLQGLGDGQAVALNAVQPPAAPVLTAQQAMAGTFTGRASPEPAAANVVVAQWEPKSEVSVAAQQRPVVVGTLASPPPLAIIGALPTLPALTPDDAAQEPAAANVIFAQWEPEAADSVVAQQRPVAVGTMASPPSLAINRALPALPTMMPDNAAPKPAAANVIFAQWEPEAAGSVVAQQRPVAVGTMASPPSLAINRALPVLPAMLPGNAAPKSSAANVVLAQWEPEVAVSVVAQQRPVVVGTLASPRSLVISRALPTLPAIMADNAPPEPAVPNVVIATWQPQNVPAGAQLSTLVSKPVRSAAQTPPASRMAVAKAVQSLPLALKKSAASTPAVPAIATSLSTPPEAASQHTAKPALSVAVAQKPVAIAAIVTAKPLPGSLKIINASGRKDGAEPVRLGLAALGWTAPQGSASDGLGQGVTILTYPQYSASKAQALARTLPFPVQLTPSLSRSGVIQLVLGADFVAWQPVRRHVPGVWRKFLTVASLADTPHQETR